MKSEQTWCPSIWEQVRSLPALGSSLFIIRQGFPSLPLLWSLQCRLLVFPLAVQCSLFYIYTEQSGRVRALRGARMALGIWSWKRVRKMCLLFQMFSMFVGFVHELEVRALHCQVLEHNDFRCLPQRGPSNRQTPWEPPFIGPDPVSTFFLSFCGRLLTCSVHYSNV